METIKEFIQSTFDSYRDRVKSPFIGSFALSFVLFNWKAFLILLYSDLSIIRKINYIELYHCSVENLIWPVVIALFYVIVLPYINLGIEWLLNHYTNKKQVKADELETARLVKRKGNANLLREIADEKAGTSEITNLQSKIESLQQEIVGLVNQNKLDNERWKESNRVAQDNERELNELVNQLRSEVNSQKQRGLFNIEHILPNENFERKVGSSKLSELINKTLEKITLKEARDLYKMFRDNTPMVPISPSNLDFFIKLRELEVIKFVDETKVSLTSFGEQILSSIEDKFSRE